MKKQILFIFLLFSATTAKSQESIVDIQLMNDTVFFTSYKYGSKQERFENTVVLKVKNLSNSKVLMAFPEYIEFNYYHDTVAYSLEFTIEVSFGKILQPMTIFFQDNDLVYGAVHKFIYEYDKFNTEIFLNDFSGDFNKQLSLISFVKDRIIITANDSVYITSKLSLPSTKDDFIETLDPNDTENGLDSNGIYNLILCYSQSQKKIFELLDEREKSLIIENDIQIYNGSVRINRKIPVVYRQLLDKIPYVHLGK